MRWPQHTREDSLILPFPRKFFILSPPPESLRNNLVSGLNVIESKSSQDKCGAYCLHLRDTTVKSTNSTKVNSPSNAPIVIRVSINLNIEKPKKCIFYSKYLF